MALSLFGSAFGKTNVHRITDDSVCASAPGKVILFGEHAVVYGYPAVAASLSDLRISVLITPISNTGRIRIVMPDLPNPIDCSLVVTKFSQMKSFQEPPTSETAHDIKASLDEVAPAALDDFGKTAILPVVYLIQKLVPMDIVEKGLELVVWSKDLPVGAGLGSSAAFGVACAAALTKLTSAKTTIDAETKKKIDQYAFFSEILLHGTPSGIDNAVSCQGGALFWRKGSAPVPVSMPEMPMLLVYTHVPRSTKELVGRVRKIYESHKPVVECLLDAMGQIAFMFTRSTEKTLEFLLPLVRTNHNLLSSVNVSHPSLNRVCQIVEEVSQGRAAAKLTGAGGGGCAIVFYEPRDKRRIERALEADSSFHFTCFSSAIGGTGVRWDDPKEFPRTKTARSSGSNSGPPYFKVLVAVATTAIFAAAALRPVKR